MTLHKGVRVRLQSPVGPLMDVDSYALHLRAQIEQTYQDVPQWTTLFPINLADGTVIQLQTMPITIFEQDEDDEDDADEDDADDAYPGSPGDVWQDDDGFVYVLCSDGNLRMINPEDLSYTPVELDQERGPLIRCRI